jgi:hypothetical protein
MEPATNRQEAHQLLELLDSGQLNAVVHLLKVMVGSITEAELDQQEEDAVAEAKEALRQSGGRVIPHDEVLADFGLTLEDFQRMADKREEARRR